MRGWVTASRPIPKNVKLSKKSDRFSPAGSSHHNQRLLKKNPLFSADPRKDPAAKLIEVAQAGDAHLESMAGGAGTHIGRGGMITQVLAAKRAARSGAHTVIASGHEPDVLPRLLRGEAIGTLLVAPQMTLAARNVLPVIV